LNDLAANARQVTIIDQADLGKGAGDRYGAPEVNYRMLVERWCIGISRPNGWGISIRSATSKGVKWRSSATLLA